MKEITTDNFDFAKLRSSNALYVDKTQYVWDLVSSKTASYFLSRPRRFGKSLLLSTLKAYFLGKKECFNGLAIAQLAGDTWEAWPVIHLDMSQASSFLGLKESRKALNFYAGRVARNLGIEPIIGMEAPEIFQCIIDALQTKYNKNVVILIDEYDKPILDVLHKSYLNEVVGMMQNFYQVVKSNVDKERFVFITGVSKFAHTSLFSGVNNLIDISQEPAFAAMLGYTEQEFRDNFADYISIAAEKLHLSREAFIEKMKKWYDGFRFTASAVSVFNPVSVGQFFRNNAFRNYWYATGTPTFLVNQMKKDPFSLDRYTREWMSPMVMEKFDATSLNPLALALQTGYLTIADVEEDELGITYRYDFPNEEIRMSWYDDMLNLVSSNYMMISAGRKKLYNGIKTGNLNQIVDVLKALFAGVSKENLGEVHEGYYRNMLYMLFTAFGLSVHAEEQVAGGRVDMAVEAYGKAYVFELKVSETGKDIDKLLHEGLLQAKRKKYADKYKINNNSVHIVALVFENKQHQLAGWLEEC